MANNKIVHKKQYNIYVQILKKQWRCTSENRMKAVASVTFDNEFVIHDIKVIESQNGLFIAMPSRKTPNGEFKDIAHPINAETREKIQKAILDAYNAPETEESAE